MWFVCTICFQQQAEILEEVEQIKGSNLLEVNGRGRRAEPAQQTWVKISIREPTGICMEWETAIISKLPGKQEDTHKSLEAHLPQCGLISMRVNKELFKSGLPMSPKTSDSSLEVPDLHPVTKQTLALARLSATWCMTFTTHLCTFSATARDSFHSFPLSSSSSDI